MNIQVIYRRDFTFMRRVLTRICPLLLFIPFVIDAQIPSGEPARSNDVQRHIDTISSCLPPPVLVQGEKISCPTLLARMAELKVPGVSIAVVHHGVLEWVQGFGVEQIGGKPVSPETLFQAGSISKPIAAMAALHFVQQGKLSLDDDINKKLTSWHVPESSTAPGAVVTLRELLTHTAGFTVHGFNGYEPGSATPTLVQVLDGTKPANTPPIRLDGVPGAKWDYSGGGYVVMQQLLIDVSHEPFPKLLHDTVLAPIGMTHSTYEQPLPAALQTFAATPYTAEGKPVAGGAHIYPEMTAAGLWTTPADLARYILETQQSLQDKANHVLTPSLTEQMLTPGLGHWGLGIEVEGSATNPYFMHAGVNAGFQSLLVGYEHNGEGAVVMTNAAAGGLKLAHEIVRSIAVEYAWPDFQSATRTPIKVDRSILARYVGTYQASPTFSVAYTLEGGQLYTQATGQEKFPVFPEAQSKFFTTVVNSEIDFHTNDKGQVDYLVLHQGGRDYKEMKK
jgi:CubicO group peptidase (beta-lactamase class C family)